MYLEQQGYKILEKNFRCKIGEIDLIAMKDSYLVFVEVKYRTKALQGNPLEAVDDRKQRKICKIADYYRMINKVREDEACRFDVVGIYGEQIALIENAFAYIY